MWKSPKEHIVYDSICTRYPEKSNYRDRKVSGFLGLGVATEKDYRWAQGILA